MIMMIDFIIILLYQTFSSFLFVRVQRHRVVRCINVQWWCREKKTQILSQCWDVWEVIAAIFYWLIPNVYVGANSYYYYYDYYYYDYHDYNEYYHACCKYIKQKQCDIHSLIFLILNHDDDYNVWRTVAQAQYLTFSTFSFESI